MNSTAHPKILFVINPRSGNPSTNWNQAIETYFESLPYSIEMYNLPEDFTRADITKKVEQWNPDQVVAVGGDGTVTAVAACLLQKNIPLGILPAGSANGMAKEFGISENPTVALSILTSGKPQRIHLVNINGKLCMHLSDVGYNARMIEKFESENIRGIWGYLKSTLKVVKSILVKSPMRAKIQIDQRVFNIKAGMIVIANATKYGSGAVINPTGNLNDEFFEIIVIKKISVIELFKMLITHSKFNPHKIEIFKTQSLKMTLTQKNHFQIDGEYLGKVDEIEAQIIPDALTVWVPAAET